MAEKTEKKPGLISRLFGARKQKTISDPSQDILTPAEQKAKRMNRIFSVDSTTFRDSEAEFEAELKNNKGGKGPVVQKSVSTVEEEKGRRPSSAGTKKTPGSADDQKKHSSKTNGDQATKSNSTRRSSNSEQEPPAANKTTKAPTKISSQSSDSKSNMARRKSAGAALGRGSNSSNKEGGSTSERSSTSSAARKSTSKSSSKDPTSPTARSPTRSFTSSAKSPTSPGESPPVFDDVSPLLPDQNSSTKNPKSTSSPNKARRSSTKPKPTSNRKGSLKEEDQAIKPSPPGVKPNPGALEGRAKPSKSVSSRATKRKKGRKATGAGTAGGVQVDITKPLSYPTTPETIYEYHRQKPFLDRNEEWLIVELNEYECLVDSIDIIKIIAKHSKFFEVEPDELWAEFFEFVEEVPSYDEIINYDVWQEFRDQRYPC